MSIRVTAKGLGIESTFTPAVRVTAKGLGIEWVYARTLVALEIIDADGLKPTFIPANPAGFAMLNEYGLDARAIVRNNGAASIDVTVRIPYLVDGLTVGPRVVVIPAGEERVVGNLPAPLYNQAGELVYFDFSSVTNVFFAAMRAA